MSLGQSFLPNLTEEELAAEISVSMAPAPGSAQPAPSPRVHSGEGTWILWGCSANSSGRSNSSKPRDFCTLTSQRCQGTVPYSPNSLLPCCDGGTALQFISAVPSQAGPWPSPHPQLLGAEGCGAHPTIILCARAATLLRCLKARGKSPFFPDTQPPFPCVPTPITPSSVTAAHPGTAMHKGNRDTTLKWQTCMVSPKNCLKEPMPSTSLHLPLLKAPMCACGQFVTQADF